MNELNYCPVCLSNSLALSSKGVIQIFINKKKMDTGQILFNLSTSSRLEVVKDIKKKLGEYFKWYSNFQNKDPVISIRLISSDFSCDNRCIIPVSYKFSIVEVIISDQELLTCLEGLGEKYQIEVDIQPIKEGEDKEKGF